MSCGQDGAGRRRHLSAPILARRLLKGGSFKEAQSLVTERLDSSVTLWEDSGRGRTSPRSVGAHDDVADSNNE